MPVVREKTNWCGWGWESMRYDFRGHRDYFLRWIGERLGVDALGTRIPPVAPGSIELPAIRLGPSDLAELGVIAGGDGALFTDPRTRLLHAAGRSLPDLLRLRRGEVPTAPDAVVLPADEAAVIAIMRLCRQVAPEVIELQQAATKQEITKSTTGATRNIRVIRRRIPAFRSKKSPRD